MKELWKRRSAAPDGATDARFDAVLSRVQFWLQGHPNKRRPWFLVRLGNAISDWRFWRWETSGGTHAVDWETSLTELRELGKNATTNVPSHWTPE